MAEGQPAGLTQLLVRGFPSWLTEEEKESLLSHFGATDVRVMAKKGKMRNSAFASFANPDDASQALHRLHQLDVLGSRLLVEYAKPFHRQQLTQEPADRWQCDLSETAGSHSESENTNDQLPSTQVQRPTPPPSPTFLYCYPPATHTVLQNICNALASVPKFYVQVLHLMNLMNLPPPFGMLTPTPPLLPDETPATALAPSDEEGSEIESDDEEGRKLKARRVRPRREVKMKALSFKQAKGVVPPAKRRREELDPDEIPVIPLQPKKIEIHIPSEMHPVPVTQPAKEVHLIAAKTPTEPSDVSHKNSEFNPLHSQQEIPSREDQDGSEFAITDGSGKEKEEESFISLSELRANQISAPQMSELSVYTKYKPGEPSLRLYIKNLAKTVTDEDLRYIFGRYVDWRSEEQVNMFDIRVMQSGRMKGQAFIGLPSEEAGVTAVEETNGYMLKGKPMVVQFARSIRAKEKDTVN